MKLFNMSKQEWKKANFTLHDHWRSEVAYKCQICHVKTNRWFLGGYLSVGPRIICPGDDYSKHDELESDYKSYIELNKKIRSYKKALKTTKVKKGKYLDLIQNLITEKKLLNEKLMLLRKRFAIFHDITGTPKSVRLYYPSSRYDGHKRLPKIDKTH